MPAIRSGSDAAARMPQNHRTVDRVTLILEEVVYRPGMTFGELARAVDAPKSSVHGFIGGLLAQGWLHEVEHRFYLGPAVYALTLSSGHIRAGSVTAAGMEALHEETQTAVFLGIQAGAHLIYVAEVGSDPVAGFEARSNIRRVPLATAGGKALLAARSEGERDAYLRARGPIEASLVERFLEELEQIHATRLATNMSRQGRRLGIATTLHNQSGDAIASVTLVGSSADMQPRRQELGEILLRHVDSWERPATPPREPI
jgi:DNA-binding IclR family transcriptional regulator